MLKVGASKSVPLTEAEIKRNALKREPLYCALTTFLRNASDIDAARQQFIDQLGNDPKELVEQLSTKVPRRAAPGYLQGFEAAVTAIKANEAILSGKRIALEPEWYRLG